MSVETENNNNIADTRTWGEVLGGDKPVSMADIIAEQVTAKEEFEVVGPIEDRNREVRRDGKRLSNNRFKRRHKEQYIADSDNSVLNSDYVEEERPFSQLELNQMRNTCFSELKLSKQQIQHLKCGHRYYAKMFSQKYKDLMDSGNNDIGNCSICWKRHKTPRLMSDRLNYFIDTYQDICENNATYRTFFDLTIERILHTWLFLEKYE